MKNLNKKFTVYVSGKISDLDLETAKTKFKAAQIVLEQRGFEVVNPFDLNDDGQQWLPCMVNGLTALHSCDGIYMLNNWRKSRGARIERIWAQELGLFIAYQEQY